MIRSSTHRPHTASCPSLPKTNVVNFQPGVAQTDDQAGLPRQPSALDYSNYIAKRYPKMEQNARAIRHVTMARHNIQNDMVTFTDKLMSALAASCTCCTARGLLDCPLRPNTPAVARQIASGHSKRKGISMEPMASAEASYRTPKAPKLTGVRLDLSDCEGESSSQSRRFRKQNTANEPPHNPLQQDAAAKQGKELEHVQI